MSGEDYSKLRRLSEDFQSRFCIKKALLDFPNSVSRALEANGPILRLPQLLWVGGQIAHLKNTKRLLDYYSSRPLQSENFDQEGRNITMPSERSCGPFQGMPFCHEVAQNSKSGLQASHSQISSETAPGLFAVSPSETSTSHRALLLYPGTYQMIDI